MSLLELDLSRNPHPVDMIEQVAHANDWAFERTGDDEIAIAVAGNWTDYHVSFSWMEDFEALRARFDEITAALRGEERTSTLADAARRALNSTAMAHAGSGMVGVDYGFAPLMNMIGPFLPGQEIIIGGATKQGKSTLIEQIVAGAAVNGHPAWGPRIGAKSYN